MIRVGNLIPLPGPRIPIPIVPPGNGNGGIVPPWLQPSEPPVVTLPVEPVDSAE